jgi:hypothetical protein
MNESDWLACGDPEPMLHYLCESHLSERKLRLLACACCRRVWHLLRDPRSRRAVEVSERYADGQASQRELAEARTRAAGALEGAGWAAYWAANTKASGPICNVFAAASAPPRQEAWTTEADWASAEAARSLLQVKLVREVVGNPFRPGALGANTLGWHGGLVRHLAEGIYEEHAFERMPILGDALEDAGCTDEQILEHCRGGSGHFEPHVRGCWVLDLILDKE